MENKNLQFNINLDIDGNELIHSLVIESEDITLKKIAKDISQIYTRKKINNVLNIGHKEFQALAKEYSLDSLLIDKILGKIRVAIANYKGEQGGILFLKGISKDQLLCRCKAITFRDVDKYFKDFKGDKKGILIESELSGVCGSCKIDFDKYYSLLDERSGYINGIETKLWEEKIYSALDDFYMICPPEYSTMKFQIISLNSHSLKIKCERGESTLKRMEIQKTLTNYLLNELKIEVKLSIIT